jgi:hypothetical protein
MIKVVKVVKVPLQLEPFLDKFRDLFTKSSYGSFRDLCGALKVCDKSKTVANLRDTMVDRAKMQAVGETFEYAIIYFNLSIPDGGLLYKLKSLGMKI